MLAIQLTIFSNKAIVFLIFLGFLVGFIQFCFLPVLNHDGEAVMLGHMYHCNATIAASGDLYMFYSNDSVSSINNDVAVVMTACDSKPDFKLNELMFRLFVGMSLFNNIVLLGSVLAEDSHSHTSLTHATKVYHPCCFLLILLALLFDLRITDSYWSTEFDVVNGGWIVLHLIGIVVVFKLLCCHIYALNHKIDYGEHKNRTIKASKALFCEGITLVILAIISMLLISFDEQLFERLGHSDHFSN